jgi:NADH:ubiquinone oxidoreductase subunit H
MLVHLIEILAVLVPVLITVAYITLLERKVLASMQRRVGPNYVGIFGILQPFSDALKLLVKEIVLPQQAQTALFCLAPAITLISALLGWAIIPFGSSLVISDLELGWLFYLAVASLGIYGVIFGGWAGNSVYNLLGGIRSTAHMISYELVLGGAALGALVLANSFNFFEIIEEQSYIWFAVPLIPLFLIFLISGLAEINRTPFDLVEAESELVSGFHTEYSGFLFVFFYLAEYSNLALISTIASCLWLGGYSTTFTFFMVPSVILGLKSLLLIFTIIWIRGTLPRLRFDLLMNFGWKVLLPVVFGLLTFVLSIYILLV